MSQPPYTTRVYGRQYPESSWGYGDRPERLNFQHLVPVSWAGLPLNIGDQDTGLFSIIEDVEGWLDSPPLTGNDASRAIADGSAWGPKTLDARHITLTGAAAGPRDQLGWLRDQLATRAASRTPAELSITDGGQFKTLSALVRAGEERFRQHWISATAFRWSVVLTAADPLLYEGTWQYATLSSFEAGEDTGRSYPREFPWQYAVPYLPNTARLANTGNWPAPVWALYAGDLTESILSNDQGAWIRLAPLATGMQIRVACADLTAEAEGGLSRASWVLAGSRPMTLPATSSSRWYLNVAGHGHVQLAWRSAWV